MCEFQFFANLAQVPRNMLHLLSLGSMVQKGKFSAAAMEDLVRTLKKVDLPTLGNPNGKTDKLNLYL